MYKRLEFYPGDKNGVEVELIHPGVLTKTAQMSDELDKFIKALKPQDTKVYILVNALGAGEYYGSNRNADFIAEKVLQKFYKTFEQNGKVYKHHKNKQPEKSLGKILFSNYNNNMHRIELVCELNKNKDEQFIQRILEGEYPAVSMGMRTKSDFCSICNHESKKLSEYCDHLKYEMNRVYPDGRKVMAINPEAKFFDISFVTIPADPTAGVMQKLAGISTIQSSAALGEEFLRIAGLKEADLLKKIELPVESTQQIIKNKPYGKVYLSQPDIPLKDIKQLIKSGSLGEIFSTLLGMRIMPKPVDFQRIVLHSMGKGDYSDELDRKKIIIVVINKDTKSILSDDICLDNFHEGIGNKFKHLIEDRAMTKPIVIVRLLEKQAETLMEDSGAIPPPRNPFKDPDSQANEFYLKKEPSSIRKFLLGTKEEPSLLPYKNPFFASTALSGLFYGLQKANIALANSPSLGSFDAFLMRRPWLIPLLIGVGTLGSLQAQKNMNKNAAVLLPNTLTRYLISTPTAYLYAGAQEAKIRKGKRIGAIQNLVRKHPFLASIIGGLSLGQAQKALIKMSSINKDALKRFLVDLPEDNLNSLYNDVINI